MDEANSPEQAAADVVRRLLRRRLRQAGVVTGRPEAHVQCEPGPRRDYAGGFEVRVKTWRPWSRAHVSFDAATGDLLGCAVARYAEPRSEAEMSRADALAAAGRQVQIPPDAELASFGCVQLAGGCLAVRLQWHHVHRGMRVEGDDLRVLLHPETKRLIEVFCRWRPVDVD